MKDSPLDGVLRAAEAARCEVVVTTEKDAVRFPPGFASDPRVRVVRIEAEVVGGGESLEAALDAVLATSTSTSTSTCGIPSRRSS